MRYWAFAVFSAAFFLSYLYRTVNSVIAPDLAQMGATEADLGLPTGAYFLSFAVCQVPVGILLHRIGSRRVQILLLPVAAAGGVYSRYASSILELVVARALVGIGAGE